jgi:signal transduction histidine kinase
LHERHAERERIARELHDTLLQSIQGLTMRFQAIANRVPADQPLRIAMEGALDRAEEALVEARDRVRDLRGHAGESFSLDVALVELARVFGTEHTVPVLVEASIDMRDMDPLARDELYGIAREAVHNAIAHAEASRIDVVIETEGAELVLRIRDDGRGIDDAVLRGGGRAGHWGLRGMQERAQSLGGSVAFASRVEGGTDVIVHVPMSRVFPSRAGWWRRWWRERAW